MFQAIQIDLARTSCFWGAGLRVKSAEASINQAAGSNFLHASDIS
jgi:hypothetical protein